ncbi:hypothetical protein CROQUDRAFT_132143 [Cronartium quercuum f. sp. fusiforme G11]|uniref:Uncharacterized protein n=1 Tax=Cronartium quercuum f. sp. fusiforme G11 TaxID=708437 RepID=A0A9P6NRB8_9BASI|nr:hypothetical protein CROQUDRAFT_132143 [Cronartium quercuum f. sp. fusiforme G11]
MFARLALMACLSSIAISAATIRTSEFPQGLYQDCQGGGLSQVCKNTVTQAWESGKLKTFTTEHQFFTGRDAECKVTWWSDSNLPVQLESIDQVEAGIQLVS